MENMERRDGRPVPLVCVTGNAESGAQAATAGEGILPAAWAELLEPTDGLSARQREVLELVAACLREAELDERSGDLPLHSGAAAQVIDAEARPAY